MSKSNTPADDGWSQAGLKIATMLSSRPEVKSKGIVGAVEDILAALDKKPKQVSTSYRELAAHAKELEIQVQLRIEETKKHKKRRNELIGACLLLAERRRVDPKDTLNAILEIATHGLGARVLESCKEEARALINSKK